MTQNTSGSDYDRQTRRILASLSSTVESNSYHHFSSSIFFVAVELPAFKR